MPLYDSDEAANTEWSDEDACLTVNFAHTVITVFLLVGFIYCRLPQAYTLRRVCPHVNNIVLFNLNGTFKTGQKLSSVTLSLTAMAAVTN